MKTAKVFGRNWRRILFSLAIGVSGFLVSSLEGAASYFDVIAGVSSGPPYPAAAPVRVNISAEGQPQTALAALSLQLRGITPTALATRLRAADSGGGVGQVGLNSFFDVFLEAPVYINSFFDLFTEITTSAGGSPLPITDPPAVAWESERALTVSFASDLADAGRQSLTLRFEILNGQPVSFSRPTITHSGSDGFFDTTLQLTPLGPINLQWPVVRITMVGSLTPVSSAPRTKFTQAPDATARGLDVLAGNTNAAPLGMILADDFPCVQAGPITDLQVYGSWLNDLVDSNAVFSLSIWSDVPAAGLTPSHPGVLLWREQFLALRYRMTLWMDQRQEQFLNPVTPPTLLGADHQIWRYDFHPANPFTQQGSAQQPKTYWLAVGVTNAPGRLFGWKTTPDHHNDAAVFAPASLTSAGAVPIAPWQVLRRPSGERLELAFTLQSTPPTRAWACNKTFYNPFPAVMNWTRVILPPRWPITNHFNGLSPSFGAFTLGTDFNNNTVMDWNAGNVAPNQPIHVGFEGPGEFPPFVSWGWWNPLGLWWGRVPQVNIAWPLVVLPNTGPVIGITNFLPIVPGAPLSNAVSVTSLAVEYFSQPVPLLQLNDSAMRSPLRRDDSISVPQSVLLAGAHVQVSLPTPPDGARYAVVIPQVSPLNSLGQPQPQWASTDWAMFPIASAEPVSTPPPAPRLDSALVEADQLTLTWTAQPGAAYRLQCRTNLAEATWQDVEGSVIANDAVASKALPTSTGTVFYRVLGLTP